MLLVTGATGHTGRFLLEELKNSGKDYKIRCFVRKDSPRIKYLENYDVEIAFGDMEDEASLKNALKNVETVIHIVNIKYSPVIAGLSAEAGVRKIIFIHTTGMFSKFRALAEDYKKIEDYIIENCKIDYVILRPTMIYGTTNDHNMHKLIQYIKGHNIFPVFGSGKSLMQPVHARDLARAVVLAMDAPGAVNKGYNISGGNALSYREILKLIAGRVNPGIRFIYIPYRISMILGGLYNLVFHMAGKKGQISIEQIKRLSENKNYDFYEAQKDFGYSPITFEEGIEEEIKSMGY